MAIKRLRQFIRSDSFSLTFQLLLGAMVMVATIPKFADIEKYSIYMIYSYRVFPMHPINIARFLGLISPYIELVIGLGLIYGVFTRLCALGWGIMSLSYFLVKIHIIFVQHRIIPCGCFPSILPEMKVTQSIWIDIANLFICAQIFFSNRNLASMRILLPLKWRERLRVIW
jgi:uncharacterized membrane protein YphA (DoxX/SURF4 family)